MALTDAATHFEIRHCSADWELVDPVTVGDGLAPARVRPERDATESQTEVLGFAGYVARLGRVVLLEVCVPGRRSARS
ncbi:MAG: hypothetical protein GY745_21560 [Actinomycetia bacterium]|nr:hypothetical protein [Actinomycetes bacterium]